MTTKDERTENIIEEIAAETEKKEDVLAEKETGKSAPEEEAAEQIGKPARATKKAKITIEAEKAAEEAKKEGLKSADELQEEQVLRRARPRKFIADGSEVFTQNVKTKLLSEIATLSLVMQEFISAYQKKEPMTAKVIGVRTDPKYGICAICNYGPKGEVYQVLVPYDKFTDLTEEELEKRKINKQIFLERRINTTIDFIPVQYDLINDTFIFVGNRILAMKYIRREMWYSTEVNGRSEYTKFQVGSLVEARVVGVYPKLGIAIELFGVESVIPINELSWVRIRKDLSSLDIHTGDIVMVKITDLKRGDEEPYPVWFKASLKQAKPDPRMIAFDMIREGDTLQGTVSMIQESKEDITRSRIFIELENDGEAICNRFAHGVKPGDAVSVKVTEKLMTERGEPRIRVLIKHVF